MMVTPLGGGGSHDVRPSQNNIRYERERFQAKVR